MVLSHISLKREKEEYGIRHQWGSCVFREKLKKKNVKVILVFEGRGDIIYGTKKEEKLVVVDTINPHSDTCYNE